MLHKNRVFEKIADWRAADQRMVLACVVATEGSTYSKPGDFIVIAENGDYQGLVSGGCVEGDLAERARMSLSTERLVRVHYDLGGEHDALWGMGAGCDGALSIVLLPICSTVDLDTLLALRDAYVSGRSALLAIKQREGDSSPLLAVLSTDDIGGVADGIDPATQAPGTVRSSALAAMPTEDETAVEWFLTSVSPAPRVLICGAAPDAHPLCGLLAEIGWSVSVYDHRPAYVDALASVPVATARCAPAKELAETMRLAEFDAVVIMSHHLSSDEHYMRAIAETAHWHYIGLLGPPHRRERIIASIGGIDADIEARLHGPAGLDIGAKEPASIALSIVAQMQSVLSARGRL